MMRHRGWWINRNTGRWSFGRRHAALSGGPDRLLLRQISQVPKRDQGATMLVPERQPPARQARAQCHHSSNIAKFGSRVVTGLQAIVGNSAAQVVHMVEPDIAGKPLQDPGQLKI